MSDDWEDTKRAAQSPFHDEPVAAVNKERRPVSLSVSSLADTGLLERIAILYDPEDMGQNFIVAPENVPTWVYDREELWNRTIIAEQREGVMVARAVTLSLPEELNKEDQSQLVRHFVNEAFVNQGMVADVVFRHPDNHSPYAHILLTSRKIDGENFAVQTQRGWYSQEALQTWRQLWTEYQDHALKETQPHDPLAAFRRDPRPPSTDMPCSSARQPSVPEPERDRDLEPDL